jgi:isopenicillin N synthase-like dioxygenase
MSTAEKTLPVIDISKVDGPDREAELLRLRAAAHDFGFFYLEGHGVPSELIAEVKSLARRFFALPEADKLEIEMVNSPHFRGYNRAGLEHTRGQPDWREQIDVGPEREALTLKAGDPPWRRLQGPNQWPSALPELKPALLAYQEAATRLGVRVLRAFLAALGLPENALEAIYTPAPNQLLKVIRYPGRAEGESRQGVGAHKDSGFVTILLQDEVSGLQVQGQDGGWIDAPPREGSFIVNIGEILELASGGYLLANVHRVQSPPAGVDRLSYAFFLGARHDATVPALELPASLAAARRGVTQDPQNPLFRDVGRNYLKSRLRSHPDVAARHHPDLVDAQAGVVASAY